VDSDFTRREREARMRKDEAALRAAEAHERARQAAARAEQLGGGIRRPEIEPAVLAELAHAHALRGFTRAREAHLRSARMHDEAAEWSRRRGDDRAAEQHRAAAQEAREAAAAEPDGTPADG
jgi:hypothetical protein